MTNNNDNKMMAEPIIIHPEDTIYLEIKREVKLSAEMIDENLSSVTSDISNEDLNVTTLKEFFPPHYPRPFMRNSLEDIEWLVQFCNNVAFDGASVSVSSCGNYLTIRYPKLSSKQLKFFVNRIIMREKLGLGDWIWFLCRENIRNSRKIIFYCCSDGILENKIDKKTISFEVANFLETIIDAWMHIQLNEDDLWLNGKGEPDPEEDHREYWKEQAAKRASEKSQEEAMKITGEEVVQQRNSDKFRQKQLNSMFC